MVLIIYIKSYLYWEFEKNQETILIVETYILINLGFKKE
jgi:hypothetical protein